MQARDRVFWVTVFCAVLVGTLIQESKRLQQQESIALPSIKPDSSLLARKVKLPDFTQYDDVDEKKNAFFDFMLPLIETENERLAALRKTLLALSEQEQPFTDDQQEWLLNLAIYYGVVSSHDKEKVLADKWPLEQLLRRVDQVPPSLALAQAANESAWGTSRFAEKGNNLFGQWCFREGCGLIPNQRVDGASHEVAKFRSPRHSVQRYMHNLNTNLAYREFRHWRAEQRQGQQQLSGQAAATTLTRYSTRGEEYIDELQAMIRINELGQYDRP